MFRIIEGRGVQLLGFAFTSSARPLMSVPDLIRLYAHTAALNLPSGICGALLYSDGGIMEYIEGPQRAVESARRRILASRRHGDIFELFNEPIVERSYEGWDVVVANSGGDPGLTAAAQRWLGQSTSLCANQCPGLALLRMFWEGQRGRA
jgi:hypothetical protein